MWVPIRSVVFFVRFFSVFTFYVFLCFVFCILFFCISVLLGFCFSDFNGGEKKRYKGKNASWVHMHTNSKRTELVSPGCLSFEEN